ncbi:MAG: HAD hydrolase-like protein [Candidatus Bathyarchaeota archaeon]|nr:HAD hydrolase-like protein [Candidatus Bathyarchaeota archaeon]MDH5495221.1 HAD hydrolase-like protein [Candidatus Bathyarchaeota archaeon]
MIYGVIFDLEETLVKLPIDYEPLYEEIKRALRISRVKPLTKTVKKLDGKSREKVYKLWECAELKALPNMSANEEGMKIYKKQCNKPVALVTMQGKTVVRKILDHFHLSFNVIVTREDEIDRVRQLRKAIDEIGLKPHSVLVVGDRDSDEDSAKQVGCKFLRVMA